MTSTQERRIRLRQNENSNTSRSSDIGDRSSQETSKFLSNEDLEEPFKENDFTIIIQDKKFHLRKDNLTKASPVFRAMLTGDFLEKNASELELPGKCPQTFVRFLRKILPGFSDPLTEETVHAILPLADEYQTDELLSEIDTFLAKNTSEKLKQGKLPISDVVTCLLEAEKYRLSKYLKESIGAAAYKRLKTLSKDQRFSEVSLEVQKSISFKRCLWFENLFDQNRLNYKLECYDVLMGNN